MRLLILGAGLVSIIGGNAVAQEAGRYHQDRTWYSERGGYAGDWAGRRPVMRNASYYQAPPWSNHYAQQASAGRMWSSWSRDERSYRGAEVPHQGGYEYRREQRDWRDCRCGPEYRAHSAEVYVRPGPVYMDRTPVYIEQRPVYIEHPPVYIQQPPIHVASPPIYVQGPPIYVESPPVYVDPPVVHLKPSEVHVAPPEVHVRPAEVMHESPPPPPPPPPTHFGDLPPPDSIPPVAPPRGHNYRQEPGERG